MMGKAEADRVPRRPDGSVNGLEFAEAYDGPETFADLIAGCRWTLGESELAFGKRLGVSGAHIADVEKGRRTVSPDRAARWARTLGYPQASFFQLALQATVDAAGLDFRVELSEPKRKSIAKTAAKKPAKKRVAG